MTVLVAEAALIAGQLLADLIWGVPGTNSAANLLSVGFGVWLYTIIALPASTGGLTEAVRDHLL